MARPRILDLFCKAGGAARGYADAGFEVVGVDIEPQPNYPFEFVQGDAIEFLERMLAGGTFEWKGPGLFSAVHASPPCPRFSTVTPKAARDRHPDLIARTRELLVAWGLPWVIENVVGSPLRNPVRLCGSSFGLDLRRHRLFETNFPILVPPCDHSWQTPRFRSLDSRIVKRGGLASVVGVHGSTQYRGEFELRCKAMQIDWMTNTELAQAIPPAFTRFVGERLREVVAYG